MRLELLRRGMTTAIRILVFVFLAVLVALLLVQRSYEREVGLPNAFIMMAIILATVVTGIVGIVVVRDLLAVLSS